MEINNVEDKEKNLSLHRAQNGFQRKKNGNHSVEDYLTGREELERKVLELEEVAKQHFCLMNTYFRLKIITQENWTIRIEQKCEDSAKRWVTRICNVFVVKSVSLPVYNHSRAEALHKKTRKLHFQQFFIQAKQSDRWGGASEGLKWSSSWRRTWLSPCNRLDRAVLLGAR